mmetsp:Transcript_129374/g.235108  ORF Transcript_129374/g.235108 Transcript_129374/m.235108 type:complete len:662 (-) Transcript_129374:142-2127(-)
MSTAPLTSNGLSLIFSGRLQPTGQIPVVLQILRVSEGPGVCYFVLSDGSHHVQSVLNNPVQQFRKFDIVEVRMWALVQSERGLLLQILDPMAIAEAPAAIGSPEALPSMQGLQAPAAPAAPAQQGSNPYAAQAAQTAVSAGQGMPAGGAPGFGSVGMAAGGQGGQGGLQTPTKVAEPARRGQSGNPYNAAANAARAAMYPVIPIGQLTPYITQWRVRVRIVGKSEVRHFVNSRGEGKLQSIELLDEEGSECRACLFGGAVDKFGEMLSIKGVYDIAGGRVKAANPRFSPHAIELTLDETGTSISPVDVGADFAKVRFDFVQLGRLPQVQPGASVDIGAVVMDWQEKTSVTTRSGQTRARWGVRIVDPSGSSCSCTLWGVQAEVQLEAGSAIFIRRAKVSDFRGGRSIETSEASLVEVDPDHEYAFQLRRWYNEQRDKSASPLSLTGGGGGPLRLLGEVFNENQQLKELAGTGNAAPGQSKSYRAAPVTVVSIPHERPVYYMACKEEIPGVDGKSARQCKRKTLPTGDGWMCALGHTCGTACARYVLRLELADATFGRFYTTAFDDEAQLLMGMPAQDLANMYDRAEQGDNEMYIRIEAAFKRPQFQRFAVTLRSRTEEYEGKLSCKTVITELTPMRFSDQAKEMLAEVKQALLPGGSMGGA